MSAKAVDVDVEGGLSGGSSDISWWAEEHEVAEKT